ncbi:UNVERIFIED_CONTAM: hypothetical protein OHV15_18660, partial [Microbacterium sp. SLM126]
AGAGLRAMTTLHAPSATAATDRLADSELQIPRSVLATPGFVNLYVYQALLPKTCECGHHGDEAKRILGAAKLHQIEKLFEFNVDGIRLRRLEGCDKCRRINLPDLNGIRGRVMAAAVDAPSRLFVLDGQSKHGGSNRRLCGAAGGLRPQLRSEGRPLLGREGH